MRIALIDPSLFTLPYDQALASGLERAGHRPRLYGRKLGAGDNQLAGVELTPSFYWLASHKITAGLPKRVRVGIKGLEHPGCMMRLLQRFRADPPDVIHFQWLPLPIIDRPFLSGFAAIAPLLLTVHDTNPFNGNPSAALQRSGYFSTLRRFDGLIVHTEQGRSRLLGQGLPADLLHVLPHGLLLPPDAQPDVPDAMTGELSFVLFGAMKPYKGLDVLLRAFAQLPAELRNQARLRVVGKPAMDLEPVIQLAAASGISDRLRIEPRFVPDEEVPSLFGPDVVAVFPYREIEASGVLSIAIARGRPVIASRLGSFAETIDDGVQGLLVPPDDVTALRDAMARMIADRGFAASCAAGSRLLAQSVPSWDDIAQRTLRVYSAVQPRFIQRCRARAA